MDFTREAEKLLEELHHMQQSLKTMLFVLQAVFNMRADIKIAGIKF